MEINQKLFENFIADWLCHSCKEPPGLGAKKQRFICIENSHPLCQDCNHKCDCGSKVILKACKQLEKKADEFPWFPCCHYKNGCREILTEDKLNEHQQGCSFRRIYCPFLKCYQKRKL